MATIPATKKKREFPHVIILFSCMILVACLLTYIIPAGQFDLQEGSNQIDANSFHYIDQTPVTPLSALLSMQANLSSQGLVMTLLLILGAATNVLASSGAINSLVDSGVKRFKEQSIKVVIPMIYLLMSILGALCGNDSLIAYVAIGVVIAKTLRLDPLCAVSMFYLPYIIGQAAGPTTGIVLVVNSMLDLPPMMGFGMRMVVSFLFYATGAFYTTRYAIKVNRDPSKSLMGADACFTAADSTAAINDPNYGKFELKALLAVLSVVGSYIFYAVGASQWGWSWNYLIALILVSTVLIALSYRMNPNEFCRTFMAGASTMGGVCVLMAFTRTIAVTLTNGNVMHTIAYGATSVLMDLGAGFASMGLYVLNLLFALVITGGIAQANIMLPLTMPVADIMSISNGVMAIILQLGDGISNCLTPMSSVLMGALALGGVSYATWMRYIWKFITVIILIGAGTILFLQMTGY